MTLPGLQSRAASLTLSATFQPPHTHTQRHEDSLLKVPASNTDALPPHLHGATHGDVLSEATRHNKHTPPTSSIDPSPDSNLYPMSSQSSIAQLDGPQDHRPRTHIYTLPPSLMTPQLHGKANNQPPKSAYRDLLPYCTVDTPLTEQQVVRLSDIAGSLREVVALAVRARTNERARAVLREALGEGVARGVVEFWEEEFEV
ncbi:hypothetical protein DPSP01_007174 [Paraphaeosphaeria sporulosa]|uniref:Uncharacterized protein n=1 Tax=Paraphaeosphaeria sporulosa TaxID=1460663 RepID=A0A177CPV4_9PLEO|nr:uncharacterized protein CC84DRAFT_587625 [Paraphaeosphaeria sporulosa]OAG08809.1 hypothetical protein CC84DRAFT_587625 [Paraphaeosphaeria sporulosa]